MKELTRKEFLEELIKKLQMLPNDFIHGDRHSIVEKKNRVDLGSISHYLLWNDAELRISEIPSDLHLQLALLCVMLGYEDETIFNLDDIATRNFLEENKKKIAMTSKNDLSDRLIYHYIDQTIYRLRREQEGL